MKSALALVLALLSTWAGSAYTAGNVLAVRNQRLVWLTSPDAAETTNRSGEADEWSFSGPKVTVDNDGSLLIVHRADLGPIMVDFRLVQDPDGSIEIEMELLTSSG